MWRQSVPYASLWLVLLLALAGCRSRPTPPPSPPPHVTVSQPLQREIVEYHKYTGRLEAVQQVGIRARVRGFLERIYFKEGTEVAADALLYQIDPRTFEAEVAKAKAEVERLKTQHELARTEAVRAESLLASRAVTVEEYQQRLAAQKAAAAAVVQARAVLESAQLELGFTHIRSPIAGRIGRTLVTKGNLVGYNEPTLLTTVVAMDPIYVYFDVPEGNFLKYQELIRQQGVPSASQGKVPVHVGLANETGYPHEGVIDFRANTADPGTGTIELRGELPNPDRLLTPGLYARVRVPIGFPQPRLLIPEVALATDQRGEYVLVVKSDHTVAARKVETGTREDDGLIVIHKGIQPDDRIVVNGLQHARPGVKVVPELEPALVASDSGSRR